MAHKWTRDPCILGDSFELYTSAESDSKEEVSKTAMFRNWNLLFGKIRRTTYSLLRRIELALTWRWKRAMYSLRIGWAQLSILLPLIPRPRPHALPETLVVSLTSYPPRFPTLAKTLRSLLRQTIRPDRMVLWIAHADFELLPQEVLDLQSRGLEIRLTEDRRSYKKILPALDAFPAAFICTADDDMYYWPTWLEELVDGVEEGGSIVPCHRALEIAFDSEGRLKSYLEWDLDVVRREESERFFAVGVGGILYPPGILNHDATDRDFALTLCPFEDDVWLFWMARRNGARYKTIGHHRAFLNWRGSQEQGLWEENQKGRSDVQIRRLIDKYGFPGHPV